MKDLIVFGILFLISPILALAVFLIGAFIKATQE